MGPREFITPLPAPWLGLGGDFSFTEPGVTTAFLAGRRSLPSGFFFACLVGTLRVDDASPLPRVLSSQPFDEQRQLLSFVWQTPFLQYKGLLE